MSILCHTYRERYYYLRAELNYEMDKDILMRATELGKDLFVAPMTIGDKITKAATPRDRNFLGAVALVAPIAVAPFSTVASIATFTIVVPVLAAKTGVDKALMMRFNYVEPARV